MRRVCGKTCGFCDVNQDYCYDLYPKCQENIQECKNPDFKDTMIKICRKTCGFCDEWNEQCRDVDQYCEKDIKECTNPRAIETMRELCRKTCGFCKNETIADGSCKDLSPSECPKRVRDGECLDEKSHESMTKSCSKSCGFCGGDDCKDINPELCMYRGKSGACNQASTVDEMKRICKRSCGFCGGCEDLKAGGCADSVRNGDCTNPSTEDAMRTHCRKSCGFCGENGGIENKTSLENIINNIFKADSSKLFLQESYTEQIVNNDEEGKEQRDNHHDINEDKNERSKKGKCKDLIPNCHDNKKACYNPNSMEIMRKTCKKTCGFCHEIS